jgi:hypothetical protein
VRWIATKPHQCFSCGRTIAKGKRFDFTQLRDTEERRIYTFKLCPGCTSLGAHFFCDSWSYAVARYVTDHLKDMDGDEPICCYDGLSPEAAEVMEEVIWPRLPEAEVAA